MEWATIYTGLQNKWSYTLYTNNTSILTYICAHADIPKYTSKCFPPIDHWVVRVEVSLPHTNVVTHVILQIFRNPHFHHECDMTHSCVGFDTLFSMSAIWFIHMCDMTQYSARVYHYAYLYAWHASYACASGHTREWSMSQDILINIQTREFKTQLLHYFSKSDNKCNHHQEFIRINNTHTATHCNTMQHNATQCNTLQHTATHCTTLQHTATHYNTLQQHIRFTSN